MKKQCSDFCNSSFTLKCNLKLHIEKVHEGNRLTVHNKLLNCQFMRGGNRVNLVEEAVQNSEMQMNGARS